MIEFVQEFHKKMGLPAGDKDVLSDDTQLQDYRLAFIAEEFKELDQALMMGDRVRAFDALLDLEYVIHGTALMMGIDDEMWLSGQIAVHKANMQKVLGETKDHKMGVTKPEGWVGPEETLKKILEK